MRRTKPSSKPCGRQNSGMPICFLARRTTIHPSHRSRFWSSRRPLRVRPALAPDGLDLQSLLQRLVRDVAPAAFNLELAQAERTDPAGLVDVTHLGDTVCAAPDLPGAVATFARRALAGRRLAWALLAEPVDPAVEVERLAFRRAYAAGFEDVLREGVAAGELAPQNVELSAAALVGALGEALVGPLSPVAPRMDEHRFVAGLVAFCLRSITDHQGAPRRHVHARA